MTLTVLCVGGGSVGHLAPIVAVKEELMKMNATVSVVCSDRPGDSAFLQSENVASYILPLPRRSLSLPWTFVLAMFRSARILNAVRPDVIFSKGGAVSVPVSLVAWMRQIPIVLHESDAVMGWANRIVSMMATKVCLGFIQASMTNRSFATGNPVRSRIVNGMREKGLQLTGLSGSRPILLVIGGSQGAQAINNAVLAALDEVLATCDIIHLTGEGKENSMKKSGYFAAPFATDTLPHLYACADLAVSRAGAGSIAELSACGIPMILVPIRGLAGDHQVKNAEAMQSAGAAIVCTQENLRAELPSLVRSTIADQKRMETLAERGRFTLRTEAARLIAETVVQSVARKESRK